VGPLNSIFAAVNTVITANLVAASIVPTFGSGGIERNQEAAAPRVVWVPVKEDIQPARGQGGDIVVDGQGNMNLPGGALPPLYTRVVDVECDIWAADRDTAETMINAVVSAVHDLLSAGSYGLVGGEWVLPEAMKNGELYRLTVQLMVPITRVKPGTTTATVTSIPETPSSTFHVGS
jgi:hypothetical protein